jgi:hypothetical protein
MSRNLSGTSWISLACAAALVVSCNKGGDSGATGAGGNPLAAATGSGGPMDYIPKDAALVVGMNWSKFKGTKFFNLLTTSVPPDAKTKYDEFKGACNIDPMNDLDSITVGVVGNLDKSSKAIIIVKGNWDEAKISKCATAYGEKKGKKLTVVKTDNITSYTPEDKSDKTVNVGWAGNLMVFTSQSMDGDKTYLVEIMKKASSVKDNKPLMDLLGKTDTSATLYGAFIPPAGSEMAGSFAKMTGGTEQLAGAYGTIKLASDLDVNLGLRFANEADAKSVADKMSKELDGAKQSPQGAFLNKTTIAASGTDAIVKVALDEKQLDQITEMAKQMAPMLMGGMLGQ